MTQIIKTLGISQKLMTSAVDCIIRIANTYQTSVDKVEVIEKYNEEGLATWQIMYTLSNGKIDTLMINRKAIY